MAQNTITKDRFCRTSRMILLALFICSFPVKCMADYDFEVKGIFYRMLSMDEFTCVVSHPKTDAIYKDLYRPWPFKFHSKLSNLKETHVSSDVELLTTNDVFGKPNKSGYDYYKGNVYIPEKVEYKGKILTVVGIDSESFMFCKHLLSVHIPSSVKDIGAYAFYGCVSLAKIEGTLNASIGGYAFAGCIALSDLRISGGSFLSAGAFMWCISLSNVSISNSIVEIGEGAFGDCPRLVSFKLEDGRSLLSVYGKVCGEFHINDHYYDIKYYHGKRKDEPEPKYEPMIIRSFYLGRDVYYLPMMSNYIAVHPFGGIEELIIGDTLVSLKRDAFWQYDFEKTKLDSVFLNPFDCPSLKKMVIGKSLKNILSFSEARLEKITAKASMPPIVEGSFPMYSIINAELWVPKSAVSSYQNAITWKDFVIFGY